MEFLRWAQWYYMCLTTLHIVCKVKTHIDLLFKINKNPNEDFLLMYELTTAVFSYFKPNITSLFTSNVATFATLVEEELIPSAGDLVDSQTCDNASIFYAKYLRCNYFTVWILLIHFPEAVHRFHLLKWGNKANLVVFPLLANQRGYFNFVILPFTFTLGPRPPSVWVLLSLSSPGDVR